ncbi:MAG: 5'-methylthioadenosine/S-adenosylhomocysteine nucleosidase [Richelia sp. RM1_1_1]|nr:5'-methylthioadenosine/S-adenosylhomocysteine nucleosidase [Richelia sp. RM1_1_1]
MPRAVILTAHFIDYQAVCSHLSNCKEETHPQGTVYELGEFPVGEQIWEVAIGEIDNNNNSSALETERAIEHFQPDIIILVGTATGIKDVQAGDVVVARKIYGYESGKAENEFLPRPEVQEPSYPLKERAKSERRKIDWRNRLPNNTLNVFPNILLAPIASGDKEVGHKQSTLVEFLRTNYGDAVAVENFAFGFLRTAHANHNILALTVHGISNLINISTENPPSGYKKIAVENASAFILRFLQNIKLMQQK